MFLILLKCVANQKGCKCGLSFPLYSQRVQADYMFWKWSQHFPSHMLFCSVTVPLPSQEAEFSSSLKSTMAWMNDWLVTNRMRQQWDWGFWAQLSRSLSDLSLRVWSTHSPETAILWQPELCGEDVCCQLPQGSQAFKSSQARCRMSEEVILKADSPPQLFLLPLVKSHPATPVLPSENPDAGKQTHHPHCLFSEFLTQGCKRIKWQLFYTRFWMVWKAATGNWDVF